ncbi:recombinase family protein [Metallumcola ferriviriculae]|uniref:Recombinase family protein n=1 Tax=Metallumcola ferriviriculae TaxID=3039180 RepID=A0AAU0UIY7_9FIRM|nr:recombinase family protein [Desulfitibacteraceae bacterium MK1]
MYPARAVKVIPATAGLFAPIAAGTPATKRVAAYARVSTDNDEQLSSYEAQVDYYTRHIKSNPAWMFIEVYADEGISATSTKKRDGFNKMIADALAGEIDLIITKSVSRFARNTVDTLTTVRQLKEKGVEVYFEKENIYTLDSKGELLISIMSSLAQEESRSISANVTWGQRKRFADGKVSLPYGQFLGYEKGEDGLPKIVEKEAEFVRLIYKLFLEGKTPSGIAKHLTEKGIKTPAGKQKWQPSTVTSILQNEKYKGDAVLQKSFTVDFLTKKKKINEGEIPQYYVENSHPAIISPETYELVQEEFRRRKAAGRYTSAINCFASRIVCGDCGGFYGRKIWHSTTKYANTVWQCNNKFRKRTYCNTPHLKEEVLKRAFVEAFNSLIENKDEILSTYNEIIVTITDFKKQEKESQKINEECTVIEAAVEKLIAENARSAIDQKEYTKRYTPLATRYNELQNRKQELNSEIAILKARRNQMNAFIRQLKEQKELLTEFNESLWCATVNAVVVKSNEEITFQFKDGTELPWGIE